MGSQYSVRMVPSSGVDDAVPVALHKRIYVVQGEKYDLLSRCAGDENVHMERW